MREAPLETANENEGRAVGRNIAIRQMVRRSVDDSSDDEENTCTIREDGAKVKSLRSGIVAEAVDRPGEATIPNISIRTLSIYF